MSNNTELLGASHTIAKSGLYLIWASANVTTTPSNGITEMSVTVNGGVNLFLRSTIMLPLSAGDIVRHRIYHNSGYNEDIGARKLIMLRLCSI